MFLVLKMVMIMTLWAHRGFVLKVSLLDKQKKLQQLPLGFFLISARNGAVVLPGDLGKYIFLLTLYNQINIMKKYFSWTSDILLTLQFQWMRDCYEHYESNSAFFIPFINPRPLYLSERAAFLTSARPGGNGILVFHFRPLNLLFYQKIVQKWVSGQT